MIAAVVINRYATLREMQTYYSYEDMYDMLEMIRVDAYNQNLIAKAGERSWRQ